ncbi:hypothetical protein NDU88_009092 [Pleurodeles waltl]|uniref:Uncharacterized protein n=1 Tax=Pleurodeles waltl TaxID=8319 RepID=A0AAV7PV11_PLEWA|nr:hypothetical protein NDU88_009092 [Pleurodeles waltl]
MRPQLIRQVGYWFCISPFRGVPPNLGWVLGTEGSSRRMGHAGLSTVAPVIDSSASSGMIAPTVGESIQFSSVSEVFSGHGMGHRPEELIEVEVLRNRLREKGPTPINFEAVAYWLQFYTLEEEAKVLFSGFLEGFRLRYQGPRMRRWANNLRSAREHPEVVRAKLKKEVDLGRIVGPFLAWPLANLTISPLGVVPKKQAGEFRLIHHLSWPAGASVNDFIAGEDSMVHYVSIDEAIALVRRCGRGAEMAKSDVESAFRLLPVHPDDFSLLGMQFEDAIYVDRMLPMGCSVSCAVRRSGGDDTLYSRQEDAVNFVMQQIESGLAAVTISANWLSNFNLQCVLLSTSLRAMQL